MNRKVAAVVLLAVMGLSGVVMAGPKWNITEDGDSWMSVGFLGQVHGSYIEDLSQGDVYLRRARIIVSGQVTDGVKFFAETDNDNAGRRGAADSSTDIQDIFVDLQILDSEHWFKAGLILLPFSFETRASAASLLGIDYNAESIKLVNTFVWRDYGAELHGSFLDQRVSYCAGVFDGYDSTAGGKNPDAGVRTTGHVAVNLIGKAETGWFYTQKRIGQGNYLSIGAGADWQEKATLVAGPAVEGADPVQDDKDSEAWVVDMQSGMDMGPAELTLNAAWYEWDSSKFYGSTAFVEGGVICHKTMLTAKVSHEDPEGKETLQDYTVGLHYFAKDHNLRGGVEYRWGDSSEMALLGLQFLL